MDQMGVPSQHCQREAGKINLQYMFVNVSSQILKTGKQMKGDITLLVNFWNFLPSQPHIVTQDEERWGSVAKVSFFMHCVKQHFGSQNMSSQLFTA